MRNILIISEHPELKHVVASAVENAFGVEGTPSIENALLRLEKKRFDFLFIDIVPFAETSPTGDARPLIEPFKKRYPLIQIVVVSPSEHIRTAIKVLRAGGDEYIVYPTTPEEVLYVMEEAANRLMLKSQLDHFMEEFWKKDDLDIVQTRNPLMKKVFREIRSVAPTKTAVLLIGETGTGKGLMARLIHRHSNRENEQYISVHCGAIPDTLLESELFGHEKGAFTGAIRKKPGKFEIASSGTIFLDEIGTITSSAQIKLLQVLHDGAFSRVGGDEALSTNARVIAATNADLRSMTDQGTFRKDLFYRLNAFPIEIPPLRRRIEDIPYLIEVFLKRLNDTFQKEIFSVHPDVVAAFREYGWPGNIREMENLMERAYILESGHELSPESFPSDLFQQETTATGHPPDASIPLASARRLIVEDFEQKYLKSLLHEHKGRINPSAGTAGITTRQLNKLMRKYGIRKEEYRR